MNIHDVNEVPSAENKLGVIFNRQKELIEKYHPIEKSNGLLQTELLPLNLHCRFCQARMKDFAWRVTEELGEATSSIVTDGIKDHLFEEIADALHFLVELMIITNIYPQDWDTPGLLEVMFEEAKENRNVAVYADEIKLAAYNVVEELSMAMNCLKQKPWKQTHMETDIPRFTKYLQSTFILFIHMCYIAGMNASMLFAMYFKKSEVNKFRQRSNY